MREVLRAAHKQARERNVWMGVYRKEWHNGRAEWFVCRFGYAGRCIPGATLVVIVKPDGHQEPRD
jgi:hypothetical protein